MTKIDNCVKDLQKAKIEVKKVSNRLIIPAIEGNLLHADYYGEFHGGYAYVSEKLELIAEKHGVIFDWDDPESLSTTFFN